VNRNLYDTEMYSSVAGNATFVDLPLL